MPRAAGRRRARREDLGLDPAEFRVLCRLSTPEKIQDFLHRLQQNFEIGGETCNTVREVLRLRRAHCIEGAMLAAAALWVHGEPPLLLDLKAEQDVDHVVALFRRRGCWGAISKTNSIGLRGRDPVYRTLRELAMSYLHEYCNKRERKTLRSYSLPLDLRRIDARIWMNGEHGAWKIVDHLEALRHFRLVSRAQAKLLTRRDPLERRAAALAQYREPAPRTAVRRARASGARAGAKR